MSDMLAPFIKMMTAILIVLFVIAIADYLYQRHEFMQKMKMSKQELMINATNKPKVTRTSKASYASCANKKARQRMIQNVPDADVVITNPTHYAVR